MTRPLRRTRVKICGLTRREDVLEAVRLGADAVGFVFWPRSPRYLDPIHAGRVIDAVPPLVARVGVFVDPSPADVAAVRAATGIGVVQLHGDEQVEDFIHLGMPVMKAVDVSTDHGLAGSIGLAPSVLPLVDAVDPRLRGGTGLRADWSRAARLAEVRPCVLAGGLDASNVAEAISAVRPWAIDVSSGVEEAPGIKDHDRLRALFAALDRAAREDV